MLSRKHYVMLVELMAKYDVERKNPEFMKEFIRWLARDNPRFDEFVFLSRYHKLRKVV